ncbi:MAG TPA: hypothetical protein VE988_10775 [Gemmataceae bacterium]|nr:hypothetical protein [Gemmataceae bacterium]
MLALFFVVAIVAGYFGIAALQDRYTCHPRTFRFQPPHASSGPPLSAGWNIDVIGTQRLANGEYESKMIVERVLMLEVQEVEEDGRMWHDITLRVTAAQAEILEQAQSRGVLMFGFCPQEESRPFTETIHEYIFGPPKYSPADLRKPPKKKPATD